MTEEFDAVLFDAGGVLWDLNPTHKELISRVLSSNGEDVDDAKLISAMRKAERVTDLAFSKLHGKDESSFQNDYDRIVLEEIRSVIDLETFSRDMSKEFETHAMKVESWVPYPDAIPTLIATKTRGFVVGLISNATELARRVLANLDMEKYFDLIVISDEVGVRKPDKRIFEIALDMAETRAHRSLFLGDRPSIDMVGAIGAGMKAILVDRNEAFPDSQYLRISSLDSLARYL
ncbi:MAG: HAD family hydrolase [Thermoplasmata archaeon]|nr:HAD family hydrolase [Thermoplasmata archaeon]